MRAAVESPEAWLAQNALECRRFAARISPAICTRYQLENPEACKGCERVETEPTKEQVRAARRQRWVARALRKRKKEAAMRTRACADCKREDVRIVGRGLCGKCYYRHQKAGTLDRFPRLGDAPPGRKRKPAAEKPAAPEASVPRREPAAGPAPSSGVTLVFADERDRQLLQALERLARRERRSVEAQCMVLLERAMTAEVAA